MVHILRPREVGDVESLESFCKAMYLPLPVPESRPIQPVGIDFKKAATTGQGYILG